MRPRIVVFTGGQEEHASVSRESGTWACQYIPRSQYDVTPVEVTHTGEWKVPMGTLPKGGDITRTMEMLFKATTPQEPKKALERLLNKPVDSIITLMRGKGGDDGAMHSMGNLLGIHVAGSGHHTNHTTFNKHRFAHAVSGIAPTPHSYLVRHKETMEDTARRIWSEFITPFFVKPLHGAGSYGIVRVDKFSDLEHAITEAKQAKKDVLIQEYRPGLELSVTVYSDTKDAIHTLPPTIITPKTASFYDYHGKQRSSGAHFHSIHKSDSTLTEQAEAIAQDVYESLGCKGIATVDMIANDGAMDVLELNTIPSFHSASPIHHQLKQAGMHPERLIASLL
jgi:D-alanine-D-alanine ligase